jgi:M6 family metalloprotease-like protein
MRLYALFFFTIFFLGCGTESEDVVVKDSTEYSPVITSSSLYTVLENQLNAFTVTAYDKNNDSLEYTISGIDSNYFNLNTSNGIVTFKQLPNYKIKSNYNISINVSDKNASDTQNVTIHILPSEIKLIIIRMQFNDYTFRDTEAAWSQKIFGVNHAQANDYFNEVSNGAFQLSKADETYGTANDGVITVDMLINHPGDNGIREYLDDAITKASPYIDFSSFDENGDGYIAKEELQIMFITAGNEGAAGLSEPYVWAHESSFSWGVNVDGVNVMRAGTGNYSIFGERHSDTEDASIGIIVHELGHAIFNLVDLYDLDSSSNGIGMFGLMSAGTWGIKNSSEQAGETPVHMCAWSKVYAGLATPTTLSTSTQNITLNGTSTSNYNIIKIPTANPKEYFLIENRSSGGYDDGLSRLQPIAMFGSPYEGGTAIWHIDENQKKEDNTDNMDETHKLVDLEEANNATLDTYSQTDVGHINNLFFNGNKTTFTPLTDPNSNRYNGSSTGISITNVSSRGDVMSFDLSVE